MEEILANYINYYIDYCLVIKNLSISTINSYSNSIKYFFNYFNRTILNNKYTNYLDMEMYYIKELNEKDFYNYICYLIIKNLNIRTRSKMIQCLKLFFDYLCYIKQVIIYNPINNIAKEKCYLNIKSINLEKSDIIKLLNYKCNDFIGIRNKTIISLLLYCGLRSGELRRLKLSDFYYKDDKFLVLGKGNKERFCYINKNVKEDLNNYLDIRGKLLKNTLNTDILFFNNSYKSMSSNDVFKIVKHVYKINNIDHKKYNVHSLRHTFATNLYKSKVPIDVIKEALGHSCIEATQFYIHIDDIDMKKNMLKHPLANVGNINKIIVRKEDDKIMKTENMKNITLNFNDEQIDIILDSLQIYMKFCDIANNKKTLINYIYRYVQASKYAPEYEKEGNIICNDTENRILELLENNNFLTQIQIAKILNLSENCIYKNLKKLKEKGLIFRIGANKSGYWDLRNKIR